MEKIAYGGWKTCYRLSNDIIEIIITGEVGLRIIRLGFVGGENVFKEFPQMMGRTGGDDWRVYGGHRLWHAPEAHPRTYFPDNSAVRAEPIPHGARIIQPVEPTTGIEKTMDITLADGAAVTVEHRLTNRGAWPVTLAPWAISVMAAGGTAILPLPPRAPHGPENLLPNTRLNLWSYTNPADPRWMWGEKFVLLRQNTRATVPQKIGMFVPAGWMGYANGGTLFVNRVSVGEMDSYPDGGSNFEAYTDAEMLEVESLGQLVLLAPGESATHTERWFLFDGVRPPENDADVIRDVLPRVAETGEI